ncbi:MAG: SdrD B-like domain-containing protein, partial [Kiritimatiellia bacterium]
STAAVYLDIYAATNSTNNVHLTTDFGYQTQTTIEGTIWHDWDRGAETNRESGEDWLTNVTVYLCASPSPCGPGASLATNVTSTNGFFRFVGNYTGTYTVAVATNTGMLGEGAWNQSWDTDGTNTANYAGVTVVSGGVARADFSYWRAGDYAIGDTVYVDWDGNGIQSNAFEEGIPAVTVYLYEDANGNGVVDVGVDAFVASAVTASNGYYSFTNLFATNTYLVYVDRDDPDLPPSYSVTGDPYGALDARSVVTITNASRDDQDFGFQPLGTGSIGDTVWKDLNADGLQSGAQEAGIANVLVSLYVDFNGDGTYVLLRTTNTSSAGTYLFGDLPDGAYRVTVDVADGDLPTDAFGSVYYPTTAMSFDVAISGGNDVLTADFGFAPYGAIGDTVFWDANRNGTQDYSEEGVAGAEVRLYADANSNGVYDLGETQITNAFTDADGKYLFAGLLPDRYVVWVVTTNGPLAGTAQSADPNSDGYACADTNNAVPCDDQYGLPLGSGQNFMGADFGCAPPGVIGDRLWVDTNDNGLQDPGEGGIPYVSVVLYSNGVAVATNETDGDGYYYFSDLPDGTWSVTVLTNDVDFPPGLAQTYDPDGVLDDAGTNVVISGGMVTSVGGVPCTDCDLSLDFGYRYLGNNSLSGTIGFDAAPYDGVLNGTNASGVAVGETAYAGVPVYLYLWNDDGDGLVEPGEYVSVAATTTATNGDYSFADLPNGDGDDRYIVASSAPEDYLKLTTTNGSIAGVSVVETTNAQGSTVSAYLTVAIAPVLVGMDFAYRSTRNYDYGDLPESYETLLPGGARHIVPAATNLYLGAAVDVELNGQPSAGAAGDDLAGTDDEDGVELIGVWQDGPAGGTLEITVGAGAGWLVGYIDFNGDGDFADFGELAIDQAASSAGGTNADGIYAIPVDVPPGTINAATTTALNARFRLFPAAPSIPELAFSGTAENGEVEDYAWNLLGSVGDYVWEDLNVDGVQDANEPPIAGARVFIDLDADGQWDAGEPASTTDTNGFYSIGGLTPGTYPVRVDTNTLALGLVPTYDRDGIGTKHVASVTLLQGEVIRDVDFGYNVAIADLAV